MRIRSVRHRGLKRFIEADELRELRPDLVSRIRKYPGCNDRCAGR
jgi:proteic killer suppression protein